jgi:hypothetical protein
MSRADLTTKAFLTIEGRTGERIPCLFNPAELTLSRTNNWNAPTAAGRGVAPLEYVGATSGSLSLTLFFDTTDTGESVAGYTQKLLDLMEIDRSLPGSSEQTNNGRPPYVQFHWGDFHSFLAAVTSLNVTFEYFSSSGTPLRAKANLTLTQFQDQKATTPQNPTSGTPRPQETHQILPGETLDRIAALHYADSTRWRAIAGENGIEDPLDLRPGRILSIPVLF